MTGPARAIAAVLLAAAATPAGADPVDTIDRRAVRAWRALALRAEREGQFAAARRIHERIVRVEPDQATSRARLGWRRAGSGWERDPERGIDPQAGDADPLRARWYRGRARQVERERADAILEEGLTGRYAGLLEVLPRYQPVHEALGHPVVNGRRVRPELADAVRRLDARERGGAAFDRGAPVEELARPVDIPGFDRPRPAVRAGGVLVSGDLAPRGLAAVARSVPAARAWMRERFGEAGPLWAPARVYVVGARGYRAIVEATLPPGPRRARQMRFGTLEVDDWVALWRREAPDAMDLHAHTLAFRSVHAWLRPEQADERDGNAHAWFKEGVAMLATIDLFDTARTTFVDFGASHGKEHRGGTLPLAERRRETCLAHVRRQLEQRRALSLHDLLGRTLNTLDPAATFQAWTFVRFLAAYDPVAFRLLPQAMREEDDGPLPDRGARALERAYGLEPARLETLWRRFTREA